jgi:hypothetical protein
MSVLKRAVVAGLAVSLVLSLGADPAAADSAYRRDPNDTAGRLDIRRIAHGHAGEDEFTHTVKTYQRFRSRLLRPRRALIAMFVETDAAFMCVVVVWRNGSLRAPIFDDCEGRVGTAQVTRPNRRSVRVTLSESDLGGPSVYLWGGLSYLAGTGGCARECFDETRPLRHVLE